MPVMATTATIYAAAATAEIVGCFAFWAWLRQGQSPFLGRSRYTLRYRLRLPVDVGAG